MRVSNLQLSLYIAVQRHAPHDFEKPNSSGTISSASPVMRGLADPNTSMLATMERRNHSTKNELWRVRHERASNTAVRNSISGPAMAKNAGAPSPAKLIDADNSSAQPAGRTSRRSLSCALCNGRLQSSTTSRISGSRSGRAGDHSAVGVSVRRD